EAYFNAEDDEVDDDDLGLPTLGKGGLRMPNGASPVRPLVNYPDDDEEEEGEMEHMQNILASSPDRDVVKKNGSSSDPEAPLDTDPTSDEVMRMSPDPEERGRDRRPVPVEGSPGRQGSPPEPMAIKRRREDEDDDELGKMMGGTKRRNSSVSTSASVANQTRHMHFTDGAASPRSITPVQQKEVLQEKGSQGQYQHQPVGGVNGLRRKGSLKTKNEGSAGRFAIKPINLSVAAHTAEAGNRNHEGVGDGTNGAGAGG
ncbi:Platinum sensitivity protein, partial [Teratosphaeriaceae sp. CCFEE 6253]